MAWCIEAEILLESDLSGLLGAADAAYWGVMSEQFGIDPPADCTSSIGLQLFGDEGEIFKGNSMMLFQWSSENSPYHTDPKLSRWLIAVLPVHMYAFWGKVNISIQGLMKHVVKSLELWQNQPIKGVGMRFVSLKGDWKYLVQVLNLKRTPQNNQCCMHCMCTKDLSIPYTDVSSSAEWRCHVPTVPWDHEPELAKLTGFGLALVGFDILHLFFLGTGRDLVSSVLLYLFRVRAFNGATAAALVISLSTVRIEITLSKVAARMRHASKMIVAFSKSTEWKLPNHWHLTRTKLDLKVGKFCHLHGKGWHTLVILKFLNHYMSDDMCRNVDATVKSCLWAADHLIGLLHESRRGGPLLNQAEAEQTQVVGNMFAVQYLQLYHKFDGFCSYKMFNARPKFHGIIHWYESAHRLRNPCLWSTYMDETWVKQIMFLASKTHQKKTEITTLQRYLTGLLS